MAALDLNDGPFTCPTCKTPGFPTLEALGDHAAACIPREPADPRWKQGARVKVVGLKAAKQHNGKLGTLGEPSDRRWAVSLDGSGRKLAVKRGNLQLVEEAQREPKTLERHHQLLAEFDGSRDPDTLALYYHTRDRAFDAYSASEYTSQLLRYYEHNLRVVCVSPRRIRGNDYALVQLRHDDDERNSLVCQSMSVVPMGADVIETWNTCCIFCPPYFIAPIAEGAARTRDPGTNAFGDMTFSADGTAKQGCCCGYKKRRTSQKRAFHKVETRDLAGKWCGVIGVGSLCPFLPICCTRRKALNEDRYAENGICCFLGLPCPVCERRTRIYVNGHPTNGFAVDGGKPDDILWYRDPGCAAGGVFFAKKLC